MSRLLVLDASVALKWFFHDRADEPYADAAIGVLQGYVRGRYALLAPPHFLAEMCAVLARQAPGRAADHLRNLLDLAIPVDHNPSVYAHAMQLSHELGHHLFDTLYHAVALAHQEAVLVTADDRYWRVSRQRGQIVRLADWPAEPAD